MRAPTPPRDPEHPWRGEEIAAPSTRREPRSEELGGGTASPARPSAEDSLRATQPLRPAEAGEAVGRPAAASAPMTPGQLTPSQFLNERDCALFRQRWLQLQAGFIDQPQETVEEADRLLADVLERLTRGLVAERESLAARWRSAGDRADTEELRVAVQGYRSMLDRLLGG